MFDDLHDPNPPVGDAHQLAVMGTTTALLVAGGVTAIALRDPGNNAATTPTAPPVVSTTVSVATIPPTTTPATTTPETTPATATPPTTSARATAADNLVELAAIAERARRLQSFGGRVEQFSTCCGGQTIESPVREVVFRADGSMWSTDSLGGWTAFDASTGTSRLAFRTTPEEPLRYQEIVGWNENSVGENVVLGFAPVLNVAALNGETTITEAPYPAIPDRLALRIDVTTVCCQVAGEPTWTDTTTYWIDQATGITLAFESTQVESAEDGTELDSTSRSSWLTTFAVDVTLPTEFPGSFPADAAVDRSGDPSAFNGALTDAELSAAFGEGLLVPDPPGASRQVELTWSTFDPNGQPVRDDGMATSVQFRLARGFDRTTIVVDRGIGGLFAGSEPIGEVTGGSLSGSPIYPGDSGGFVVLTGGGPGDVRVTVLTPTVEQAAELLATMRPPSG